MEKPWTKLPLTEVEAAVFSISEAWAILCVLAIDIINFWGLQIMFHTSGPRWGWF